jgi:metal-dependent HD superfamily phosphatase/phosphodiesterase
MNMDYNSLPDNKLGEQHRQMVTERLRLIDELWEKGIDPKTITDEMKAQAKIILNFDEIEKNIALIDEVIQKRKG